jgi:hypothetical protein
MVADGRLHTSSRKVVQPDQLRAAAEGGREGQAALARQHES